MVAKFLVVALSCIFIAQIHHVSSQDSQIVIPSPVENEPQKEFKNPIAAKTINTLLRHFRISMTHPVSGSVIRYIFTAVRFVLTDQTGQKTVKHLVDFIVDILMDENTLKALKVFHKRLVQLAASGRKAAIVLETAAGATRKIIDEPQVLAATEGLFEGINILMEDMTDKKLREGIVRVARLQRLASYIPKSKKADTTPAASQKLKRTNSDVSVGYQSLEGDRGMQLQTRSVGYDDEHGWINRKGKAGKGRKGQGKDGITSNEGPDELEGI